MATPKSRIKRVVKANIKSTKRKPVKLTGSLGSSKKASGVKYGVVAKWRRTVNGRR